MPAASPSRKRLPGLLDLARRADLAAAQDTGRRQVITGALLRYRAETPDLPERVPSRKSHDPAKVLRIAAEAAEAQGRWVFSLRTPIGTDLTVRSSGRRAEITLQAGTTLLCRVRIVPLMGMLRLVSETHPEAKGLGREVLEMTLRELSAAAGSVAR